MTSESSYVLPSSRVWLCSVAVAAALVARSSDGAVLELRLPPGPFQLGQEVEAKLFLDSEGDQVAGFDVAIRFDPQQVAILDDDPATSGIQIRPEGGSFSAYPTNEVDPNGVIRFSGISPHALVAAQVATIRFRAVRTTFASFAFVFFPGRPRDTVVASFGTNVLREVRVIRGRSCDDGVDNDGDSLVDYPDDDDCPVPDLDGESPHPNASVLSVILPPGPYSSTTNAGVIELDTDGTAVFGVDFELLFDPSRVEILDGDPQRDGVQIEGGTLFIHEPVNEIDTTEGRVSFAQAEPAFEGTGELARFRFRSLTGSYEEMHWSFSPGSPVDANAAYGGADTIRGVSVVRIPDCADGEDNDGDGAIDFGPDVGCWGSGDVSERDPHLPCDDGIDNDGDLMVDMADLGCGSPAWKRENPGCQNGQDDDNDGTFDFDGGVSIWGGQLGPPDTNCSSYSDYTERKRCGLGFEVALVLPGLMWLRRRRSARTRPSRTQPGD